MQHSVIIIGSGPAAFTAAIYAARANLKPLVLEGELSDTLIPGGQLMTTTEIENFPGFPDGVDGSLLVDNMKSQAEKFGALIVSETVTSVSLIPSNLKVFTKHQTYTTKTLIIATGAVAKRLMFPGSEDFWMKGISACAVCDGALPIFRNKPLAVVGGGDTAAEEASFLSKFGSQIYLLVRNNTMRASKIMQDRVLNNPKIKILYNTEVVQALPNPTKQTLGSLTVIHNISQKTQELTVSGLFFAIGHQPASEFLEGQIAIDDAGYIVTHPNSTQTSVPGVFAAGDVQDKKYRQAITAAASGCMAALEAEHYLNSL